MQSTLRNLIAPAAVAILTAISLTAHASVFQFSYQFSGGPSITGTLEGTTSGQYVTNVSNVELSVGGTSHAPAAVLSFWVTSGTAGEPFAVSFDAALNNFWFADPAALDISGLATGNGSYGFALVGSGVSTPLANANGKDLAWYINGSSMPGGAFSRLNNTWSLSQVPEPVSMTLVGVALAGLVLSRRRSHQR